MKFSLFKKKLTGKRSKTGHIFNWQPDLPDHRDLKYGVLKAVKADGQQSLPSSVDLRSKCSPVFDQGQIGSCTGNSLAGAVEFLELMELPQGSGPDVFAAKFDHVSRLFIYYNERALEGTVNQDAGAQIRDGIKSLSTSGVCTELTWPYSQSVLYKKPNNQAYSEAVSHKISTYYRIESLDDMKHCLAAGFPFVFGFTVYSNFEDESVATTGVLTMPSSSDECIGGHAVMAVGYDDAQGVIIVRNSWGSGWGQSGYFTMPYEYITNTSLADDMWTIRR